MLPTEMRDRQGWEEGAVLIGVEGPRGVLLMSREDARDAVRKQLAGHDVVQDLIEERARGVKNVDGVVVR